MQSMNVTDQQAVNIVSKLPASAVPFVIYVPEPRKTRGVLEYPDGFADEVEAIDKDAPALGKRQFTFLEFMDLFTASEQLAIAGAAMTDAPTKLWYDRAVGAAFISLDDPRVPAGLQAMVDNDVITAARRDRVLQGLGPED